MLGEHAVVRVGGHECCMLLSTYCDKGRIGAGVVQETLCFGTPCWNEGFGPKAIPPTLCPRKDPAPNLLTILKHGNRQKHEACLRAFGNRTTNYVASSCFLWV